MIVSFGRGGSMQIVSKENIVDVMTKYFNHPIWKMKYGDPVPDMPLDIQLEFVNSCNLSCCACPILHQKRRKSFLTWEILKRIVDEAASESVCYFTICGIGEAALHPNLFDFFSYVRSKSVEPNGMRCYQMMPTVLISNLMWPVLYVEKCIENPPDLLCVSLAGLKDEEIAERRGKINVDRFYENVRAIYSRRSVVRNEDNGKVPVIHVSTHVYPHEMEERKADIERFQNKWLEVADAVVIKPTMLDTHHRQYDKFLGDGFLQYDNISSSHFERTAPCMEVSRRLSINSDGDVWCGHHNSEEFGQYLGNVYEQSIREIWHSEKMNEFRKEVRAGIFNRTCCKLCGGEIRDFHRTSNLEKENEIIFGK